MNHRQARIAFWANRVYRGWRGRVKSGLTTWEDAIPKARKNAGRHAPELYDDEIPAILARVQELIREDAEQRERKVNPPARPTLLDPTQSVPPLAGNRRYDGGQRRVIKKGTEMS